MSECEKKLSWYPHLYYYSEDEKKEITPFFIDEKYKIPGIVSTKINMLINFDLLNDAVAWWIRQASDNTWNY